MTSGRRRVSAVVLALALAVIATAFTGCGDEPLEWMGKVLEVDGIQRVENPVVQLASMGEVSFALKWSTTGPEGSDYWENPNRLHVFEDLVYLVDRQASRIHRISTAGKLRGSLGEPGEGPGQYRRITDAIPTAAGLFVVDMSNGRVEVLEEEGEITASHPLDRVVFQATPYGDDAVAVFGLLGSEEGWMRIDESGNQEPLVFPDFEPEEGGERPASRASTWGEKLVRLRYTWPEVRVYSGRGKLERVIELPLAPEDATDEEIEGIVGEVTSVLAQDGLPSGVIQQQVDQIRNRPREKFRFRRIVFDDAGGLAAIWEQNPEDFGSGDATLHLLTNDGIYLAELRFDRPWSDFALDEGVLYVLSRDPVTDLASLMAYELAVPGGLMERAHRLMMGAG